MQSSSAILFVNLPSIFLSNETSFKSMPKKISDHAEISPMAWILFYLYPQPPKFEPVLFPIETHSGRAVYDLTAAEAIKTGEAALGIQRPDIAAWFDADHPYAIALHQIHGKRQTAGIMVSDSGTRRMPKIAGEILLRDRCSKSDPFSAKNSIRRRSHCTVRAITLMPCIRSIATKWRKLRP